MRSSQRANLQAIRPLGVRGVPTGRAHEQGERVEVSVVVPARDEELTIGPLTEALGRELTAQLAERGWQGGYEIVIVDDGSRDGTWGEIERAGERDRSVCGVRHPRGLGKAAALATGIRLARGDRIVLMDADLQDDPTELPRFLNELERFDVVCGWKRERKDPLGKRVASRIFNAVCRRVFGLELHDMNCGFKALRREAAEAVYPYLKGELHRYVPVFASAAGFTVTELAVRHHPRRHGRSKYGLARWLAGACDLVTVLLLTRYRERPAHAFGSVAVVAAALAGLAALPLTLVAGTRTALAAVPVAMVVPAALLSAGFVAELVVHGRGGGASTRHARHDASGRLDADLVDPAAANVPTLAVADDGTQTIAEAKGA